MNIQQPDSEIIDRTDLRAIFTLRKRQWASGAPVRIYVLPDKHPVHEAFVKENLHLFPYQLRQIWNRLVFSGTGVAPEELETEAAIIEAVSANPNAIGYVNGVELPDNVKELPVPVAAESSLDVGAETP